jgi:hypothetical protein
MENLPQAARRECREAAVPFENNHHERFMNSFDKTKN